MGIAFSYINKMDELGLFQRRGTSILDIGSSNLYSASADGVKAFLERYPPASRDGLDEFAARLAAGSAYDPIRGGLNEAFAGELFEKAGMTYESFDIASGYRTTILDLNRASLPAPLRGKFDLVLNFGTTEHILNQLNCFSVIHDATKVGGYIYHSLPAVGYVNHGYVTYTGKCFFDVAACNGYEIVACWFDGPSGGASIFDSLQSYSAYFPALKKALDDFGKSERGRALGEMKIPDIGINVVLRKHEDRSFRGALEASTSVGVIPTGVYAAYAGNAKAWKLRIATALRAYPWLYMLARRVYRFAVGR
jgi:SAM-dependent methyltransferase